MSTKKSVEDFWKAMQSEEQSRASKINNIWAQMQQKPQPKPMTTSTTAHAKTSDMEIESPAATITTPTTMQSMVTTPPVQLSPEELLKSIQRDLNCLNDPNVALRRSSLQKLNKIIFGGSTSASQQVQPQYPLSTIEFLFPELLKPLLKMLSDPSEVCREYAANMLTNFVAVLDAPKIVDGLSYIVPVIVARIGATPVVETSEEVRLVLVRLTTALLRKCGTDVKPYLDELTNILTKSYADPFSEVKQESCTCTIELCKAVSDIVSYSTPTLAKHLKKNLAHQHSKTRLFAVKALGTIISHGAFEALEEIDLFPLITDNSSSVREAMLEVAGDWLLHSKDSYSHQGRLLPLILIALSDEIASIQKRSFEILDKLGEVYEKENEDDLKDVQDFGHEETQEFGFSYPFPLTGRPRLGSRYIVRSNASKLVPNAIKELGDWNFRNRVTAARFLQKIIIYCEAFIMQHLEGILSTLFKACRDDEPAVVNELNISMELIGRYVDPETYLIPAFAFSKPEYNSAPNLRANALYVLSNIFSGASADRVKSHLPEIVTQLSKPEFSQSEHTDLRIALIRCISALLDCVKGEAAQASLGLFSLVLDINSQTGNIPAVEKQGKELMLKLANALGLPSQDDLFKQHFQTVLKQLVEHCSSWNKTSPELAKFETLLKNGGRAVGDNFQYVVPILSELLAKPPGSGDTMVTLRMFTLLNNILVGDNGMKEAIVAGGQKYVNILLGEIMVPNGVWRNGRVYAAVRKVDMACMSSFFRQQMCTAEQLKSLPNLPELLKVVLSCLDEDDNETRFLANKILNDLMSMAGHLFDYDQKRDIYFELKKRMDDSSDVIRKEATTTFITFFKLLENEPGFIHSFFADLVRDMLIHMDDTNASVQESVLACLKAAAKLDPNIVIQETAKIRDKHRTPAYADQLMQHAQAIASPSSPSSSSSSPSPGGGGGGGGDGDTSS